MTDNNDFDAAAMRAHTAEERERYYREGWWQDKVLYDFVHEWAVKQPDRVAVSDDKTELSYAQLREDGVRLAAGLRDLGVKRGDRVGAQLPGWAEFATLSLALSRLGAVLVPIMPIFRQDEVTYIVNHAGIEVAFMPEFFHKFHHSTMYDELRGAMPGLRETVVVRATDETPEHMRRFESLFAEGDVEELDRNLGPTAGSDDTCLVVYTSGTTARPKGCEHTFNTIYSNVIALIRALRMTSDDVLFCPSPVAHTTGFITGVVLPLLAGGGTHFQAEWDPEDGLRRIAQYRCSITFTAATFLTTLMQTYRVEDHDMSSMRLWVCAGAPIRGELVQAARSRFPDLSVLSLYGRSESLTTTMCTVDDAPERSVTSDGREVPGASVRLLDEDGNEVPVGTEGEISYRGPSLMLGYYRNPEQTDLSYAPNGYSRSGDLGVMDADGYVRVTGRIKDIIIRGGLNISAREIEDHLGEMSGIDQVAVVSMPDDRLGEKSCAFITLLPGAEPVTLEEVIAFLRARRTAVQKLPERLEVIDEMPMTPVGKIRKNVLRDRIRDRMRAEGVLEV